MVQIGSLGKARCVSHDAVHRASAATVADGPIWTIKLIPCKHETV